MDLSLGSGKTWPFILLILGFRSESGIIKSSQQNWGSANGPASIVLRVGCRNEHHPLGCFECWRFCLFAKCEELFYVLGWKIFRCGMCWDHSQVFSAPLMERRKLRNGEKYHHTPFSRAELHLEVLCLHRGGLGDLENHSLTTDVKNLQTYQSWAGEEQIMLPSPGL